MGIVLSRRRVLGAAIGATAAAAASVEIPAASAEAPWAALVGDTFRVRLSSLSSTTVRLTDVEVSPRFTSLTFTGSEAFAQGTYRISSDRLGHTALFLVPIGASQPLRRYEAIVSGA